MSQQVIDRYCKIVGKQLICLPETRQELLEGLRAELAELPPDQSESLAGLEVHYGKASQTAVELQEAITPGERAMALTRQRRRHFLFGVLGVALILLLTAFIIFLWNTWPVVIVTELPMEIPATT